jgi:hypothetical protein
MKIKEGLDLIMMLNIIAMFDIWKAPPKNMEDLRLIDKETKSKGKTSLHHK